MRFVVLRHAEPGGPTGCLEPSHDIAVRLQVPLSPAPEGVCLRWGDGAPQRSAGSFLPGDAPLDALVLIEAPSREAALAWLASQPEGGTWELREPGCASGLAGVDPTTDATQPRFLVMLKADADTEAERAPPPERLERMGRCNEAAVRAGLLLAGDGLRSTALATRVTRTAGRTRLVDGPFAETKELVAGFWLVQAERLDDVLAWVLAYPYPQARPEVEVRPVRG